MSATKIYQSIIENLNGAVLMFDSALCVSYLNPAAEMLFAISARQARGMSVAELMPEATGFVAALKRALETQHPFTEHELQLHIADKMVTLEHPNA